MLLTLKCEYRFVVTCLPLMYLVEVETDRKLPIPPPMEDEELKEIPPPPISPNVLKPVGGKKHRIFKSSIMFL